MTQKTEKIIASVSKETRSAWTALCSDTGMSLSALLDLGPSALRNALKNVISMREQRTPETAEATESRA